MFDPESVAYRICQDVENDEMIQRGKLPESLFKDREAMQSVVRKVLEVVRNEVSNEIFRVDLTQNPSLALEALNADPRFAQGLQSCVDNAVAPLIQRWIDHLDNNKGYLVAAEMRELLENNEMVGSF